MGYEIELKAHIDEQEVERLLSKIRNFEGTVDLGRINKEDIYWADSDDSEPVFRTRYEVFSDGSRILFTSKPYKTKTVGTEFNTENEFTVSADQWDKVIKFVRGLGLCVCRHKYKNGWHFECQQDGFNIHAEILEVKYLGYFLEMEIAGDDNDDVDKIAAETSLHRLLENLNVSSEAIEPKGYNRMLTECGHRLG
ncbi:MAG: CYTH domain-containing protein [Sphaerochaetaceae bacterium]|nr:CYTH domain-containing protein [Sphaerochaetaceae bacterium]